ncbi:hypothetical protein AN1V17_08560 [Vallitalea sediminicola]
MNYHLTTICLYSGRDTIIKPNENSNRTILNFNTSWLYSNQDDENYKSITCDESRFISTVAQIYVNGTHIR